MTTETITGDDVRPAHSRVHRWLLVTVGVALVGIGAVGVFVPGLPTVVFLLGASWCFARSCPWLEERFIRIPLFKPFFVYLDNGARMPRRVMVWTLIVMWVAIGISSTLVSTGANPKPFVAAIIAVAGVVGSYFVIRLGRRRI
ncbi:MAG: YbaN family protein [Thermoanaerobaculales bacterium]|nr:YbaN family protein [Thermoanaerobaculales bacterium]